MFGFQASIGVYFRQEIVLLRFENNHVLLLIKNGSDYLRGSPLRLGADSAVVSNGGRVGA